MPTNVGAQPRQLCRKDGRSQFVSHLDVDSNCSKRQTFTYIAIGWEPDLLFKVDVNRLEASDTQVIVAVFHFRGMWTETKGGRLQNYHHNLSLALCVILEPF